MKQPITIDYPNSCTPRQLLQYHLFLCQTFTTMHQEELLALNKYGSPREHMKNTWCVDNLARAFPIASLLLQMMNAQMGQGMVTLRCRKVSRNSFYYSCIPYQQGWILFWKYKFPDHRLP